jgi:hypothetical protein
MTTKSNPKQAQAEQGAAPQTPACLVRAAGPSIRAAGHRFGAEPTPFAAGELSAEQYAALCADARLVVLPAPAESADPKAG